MDDNIIEAILCRDGNLNPDRFSWDQDTRTLVCKDDNLVLDFSELAGCIIEVGNNCTIRVEEDCDIVTGNDCTITLGKDCTVVAGHDCTINLTDGGKVITGDCCTINVEDTCELFMGRECTINAKSDCKINFKDLDPRQGILNDDFYR